MTLTREEKVYRGEIEGRIRQIESVLIIPGETGEDDQSVCLSGWRHLVEKQVKELREKWEPLFNVGTWIDKTEERLKGLERSGTLEEITADPDATEKRLTEIEARIDEVVEIDKRYKLKDEEVRGQAEWIKEHNQQSKSIEAMQTEWNKFLKDAKPLKELQLDSERMSTLERMWQGIRKDITKNIGDWREHELELYGKTEENGNGLTRRIERMELRENAQEKDIERIDEALQILFGEIWWIRKGVLLVLILTLWGLGQFWWRFGW